MGRRRKAWLVGGSGIRRERGRRLPGYYVRWSEYTPSGRRINHGKHFLSRRAAATWVRRHNARLDLQTLGEIVPVALRDAIAEFTRASVALARDTQTHYGTALGFLAGPLGDCNVCDVRGQHIDDYIAQRLAVSGPATAAKHLRALRRFFNWARHPDRRYAARNPVDAATAYPDPDSNVTEKPVVTEAQLARLYQALDTDDRRLAVLLALTTGLDRGVITRLCTAQIDIEQAVIFHRRPKTGKVVPVAIHRELLPVLAARLNQSEPAHPLLSGLQRQAKVRDWWARATAAAGLPGFQFRFLRPLASARLQRLGGASLRDAQALLGHSSILTTARHYHVPDPTIVAALARTPLPGFPAAAKRRRRKRAASGRQAS